MDLLSFNKPPVQKVVGEGENAKTLSFSVLLNEDMVTMAAALRQLYFDLIDQDKTIKSPVERAKAKMAYTVGVGDVVSWALYDPQGQAFALYLSLRRLHPDVKQEDIMKAQFNSDEQFELVYSILGIPEPSKDTPAEGEGEKKVTPGTT